MAGQAIERALVENWSPRWCIIMHMNQFRTPTIALVFCLPLSGCVAQSPGSAVQPPTAAATASGTSGSPLPEIMARQPSRPAGPVLRVRGMDIVDAAGNPLLLRGVAFGNQVWGDVLVPRQHHSELDYQRLREMGMNAVRFYLNHRTFEDATRPGAYKAEAWQWLDDNIAWARANGVYLVLNMHVPPGGYQSMGGGKALWTDSEAQKRFILLWQAIADRYRGEAVIAGYDLLNEPVVTKSIDQWRELAERTIAAIRQVDPEHIVFIERVNAIGNEWGENRDRNFFRVRDANVAYEFHFYKPFHFTHQNASWVDFAATDQRYPDERVAEVEWFNLTYATASYQSPRLPAGTSGWQQYVGAPLTISNPAMAVGKPALVCAKAGTGTAYFDDIVLERLESGKVVETLWQDPLQTRRGWYFWTPDNSGRAGEHPAGHSDSIALTITGTQANANLSADYRRFPTKPGATYRLSGWMRGENIPNTANCQIQLQLYVSKVPVTRRNADFVRQELEAYLAWGKREQVPLYLGEWGAINHAFERDRGGLRWASDMLELLLQNRLSFAYHDYHEPAMGIFYGEGSLPNPADANRELIELFRSKLNPK